MLQMETATDWGKAYENFEMFSIFINDFQGYIQTGGAFGLAIQLLLMGSELLKPLASS